MSTYVNIELYDCGLLPDDSISSSKAAVLFHSSAVPFWQLGLKLEEMLGKAKAEICSDHEWYGWRSAAVAALLTKFAMEDEDFQTEWRTIPAPFEPCLDLHHLCDYVWRIFLSTESDEYDIQCYSLDHERDVLIALAPVDWRHAAKATK